MIELLKSVMHWTLIISFSFVITMLVIAAFGYVMHDLDMEIQKWVSTELLKLTF